MTQISPCGRPTIESTKSFLQPRMQSWTPCWSGHTLGQFTTTQGPALSTPRTQPCSSWPAALRRSSPAAMVRAWAWRAGATGRTSDPMKRTKPNAKLSFSRWATIRSECRHLWETGQGTIYSWLLIFGILLKLMKKKDFSDLRFQWLGNGLIRRSRFKTFRMRPNSTR